MKNSITPAKKDDSTIPPLLVPRPTTIKTYSFSESPFRGLGKSAAWLQRQKIYKIEFQQFRRCWSPGQQLSGRIRFRKAPSVVWANQRRDCKNRKYTKLSFNNSAVVGLPTNNYQNVFAFGKPLQGFGGKSAA